MFQPQISTRDTESSGRCNQDENAMESDEASWEELRASSTATFVRSSWQRSE